MKPPSCSGGSARVHVVSVAQVSFSSTFKSITDDQWDFLHNGVFCRIPGGSKREAVRNGREGRVGSPPFVRQINAQPPTDIGWCGERRISSERWIGAQISPNYA